MKHTETPWTYKAMGKKMFHIYKEGIIGQFNSAHYSERGAENDCAFIVAAANYHDRLCDALNDLLSTENCVCLEAELEKGKCSVCTYEKLLEEIKAEKS